MIKFLRLACIFFIGILFSHCTHPDLKGKDYTNRVNPFIGTGADGNTFPGASMPFGGVQLSPDTQQGACSGYAYADKSLSLIHISEPTRRTPISYAVFCL